MITAEAAPTRAEVLAFLVSPAGAAAWSGSERASYRAMRDGASADLAALLRAIDVYETFSRLLTDAWESSLHLMTIKAARTRPADLAASPAVRAAAPRVPAMWCEVSDLPAPFGLAPQFDQAFAWSSRRTAAEEWVVGLLEHHLEVQRHKPPDGENPWFEMLPDGSAVIRAPYRQPEAPERTEEYVHAYRTGALLSFARDLGMVRA